MRDGCSVNWTWIDDGLYSILVTVYDEEGDETTDSIEFEILNRAPASQSLHNAHKSRLNTL